MAIIYLMPRAIHADSSAWTLTGAPTKWEAVDDPVGAPDDATSYIELVTADPSPEQISFSFDAMPEAVAITGITAHFRATKTAGTVTVIPYLQIGAAEYDGAGHPLGGTWTDETELWANDPSTGLPFSKATVDAMAFGLKGNSAAGTEQVTQMYLEVDFVPSAIKIGAARDVGSRLIRLFRRAIQTFSLQGPLTWADPELMTDVAVIHEAYPGPNEGAGARYKAWQRALARLFSTTIDLDQLTVTLQAVDLRHYLCRFWDTAISTLPPGATAPGAARLDPGVTRNFSRGSKAWVQNAAVAEQGSIQIVEIGADVEKNEPLGLLLEEERQNDIVRSAFGAGVSTGWTVTGNVVDDTADLLFDPDVTAQSAHFARSGVSNCRLAQTTASYSGSQVLCLSMWHKDEDGQPLGWTLTRSTDGFYFNNATPGFQAGAVTNTWTVRSTPTMDQSNPITLSAAAQTLTLTIYAETASGQDNHLYHAQLEEGRFATSPIVTGAAVAMREADVLEIENDDVNVGPVWLEEQQTCGITFVPEWSSSDTSLDDAVLLDVVHDSGEGTGYERVLYRPATGQWRYELSSGGALVTATKTAAVTRGTPVRVVARRTGETLEMDAEAFTISIFVDGAKGTDATAAFNGMSGAFLYIGSKQGVSDWANGNVSHISTIPFVLEDDEIPDWL